MYMLYVYLFIYAVYLHNMQKNNPNHIELRE